MTSLHWPIRRLGPYSCVLGFLVIGVATLGLSRAALIGWQWQRVDGTDSLLSMLVQGARSDLITLSLFAAPSVVLIPFFLAARRMNWWLRIACGWLTVSLTAILFLELATPLFLSEYDMRPNRLFVEYLAYPREVSAMLWGGYRGSLALIAVVLGTAGWLIGTMEISSLTEQGPCRRYSNNCRRVGSPNASRGEILSITYISINLFIWDVKICSPLNQL